MHMNKTRFHSIRKWNYQLVGWNSFYGNMNQRSTIEVYQLGRGFLEDINWTYWERRQKSNTWSAWNEGNWVNLLGNSINSLCTLKSSSNWNELPDWIESYRLTHTKLFCFVLFLSQTQNLVKWDEILAESFRKWFASELGNAGESLWK